MIAEHSGQDHFRRPRALTTERAEATSSNTEITRSHSPSPMRSVHPSFDTTTPAPGFAHIAAWRRSANASIAAPLRRSLARPFDFAET